MPGLVLCGHDQRMAMPKGRGLKEGACWSLGLALALALVDDCRPGTVPVPVPVPLPLPLPLVQVPEHTAY